MLVIVTYIRSTQNGSLLVGQVSTLTDALDFLMGLPYVEGPQGLWGTREFAISVIGSKGR